MQILQAKNQIRAADVTGTFDQVMAIIPKAILIVGFVLLCVLVWRAITNWKTMTTTDLAAVVIAFALIGRG